MRSDRPADRGGAIGALDARERAIRTTLLVEGLSDLVMLCAKALVGVATHSAAVVSDAIHSLADLINNVVALVAMRLAAAPPDREHPYGHRRYESLAVFLLATLLAVLAIELARHSFGARRVVSQHGWSLAVMIGVFSVTRGACDRARARQQCRRASTSS